MLTGKWLLEVVLPVVIFGAGIGVGIPRFQLGGVPDGAPVGPTENRVTQLDEDRLTEAGETRVVE